MENAVTDYNGAKNIINGMYSVIAKSSNFGGELAGRWASQAGVWNYNNPNYNMTYKEGSNDFGAIWQSWYGLVNSANAAVIALTNLDVKLYPSPETKEALIAEARCMRAWAYANLFWMFGHWWKPTTVLMVFYTAIRCSNRVICRFPESLSENLIRKFLKIWNRG